MPLILRAIITGFGYKIGAELGRLFAEKVGIKEREEKAGDADLPEGIPSKPPGDDDSEEDDGDERASADDAA